MRTQTRTWLLLSLLLCTSALAEPLRLVTGDNYAPFTGKALPAGGMLTQVVHAALAQSNTDSTLEWEPWNRGYLKTLRGEYDATFPYVLTPLREQAYFYSAPLLMVEQHIYSRAVDPIDTVDPELLRGRTVCVPLGWQPPAQIQGLLEQGILSRHSPIGIKECARLVLIGRDDFFVADRRLGDTALQLIDASDGQLRRSTAMISASSLHLIVPNSHPRGSVIIAEFNAGLDRLKVSGAYQQVIEGYIQSRALTQSTP
tara:strand:+ start:2574 stop:3344 length:771 start_codon:yes stop_codon:yes gene_type:complete